MKNIRYFYLKFIIFGVNFLYTCTGIGMFSDASATIDLFRFKDGRVHIRKPGVKGLNLHLVSSDMLYILFYFII